MPFTLKGETLAAAAFVIDDIQYPANVLDLWPRADLEALGLVWVDPPLPPEPTLDEVKAAARASVRAKRWASHIVVTFNGVAFASDDTAATRLVAAISARQIAQAMGLEAATATAGWEAKDGSTVDMTLNDQRGLLLAGVAKTQRAFDRQAVLMAEIDAAETAEAVNAIDQDTGWPE
ncbi:DUF4376 domain-containing protein [uncultured Brevundimonas sp.]|uniref:DUF4376 domain-containing protein n=1 Tax=uncultured Brevundimonas sp. TaxID=213418 RepID=UPI0025E66999|nr:DUF4376 domain-containing protein [uncultured Brevundimonas sp.]